MEQNVVKAREEEQANMHEEIKRVRAEVRADMECMRTQFKQARGIGSWGTSPSTEDDPGKTIQEDAKMTGAQFDGQDEV